MSEESTLKNYDFLFNFIDYFKVYRNEPEWLIDYRKRCLKKFLVKYVRFKRNSSSNEFKDELIIDFEKVMGYINIFGEDILKLSVDNSLIFKKKSESADFGFNLSTHCINNSSISVFFDSKKGDNFYRVFDIREDFNFFRSFICSFDDDRLLDSSLYSLFISALWLNGLYVEVLPKKSIDDFIHLNFEISEKFPLQLNLILLVVGNGSSVKIIEECESSICNFGFKDLDENFHYGLSYLFLKEDSHVEYFSFGNWDHDLNLANLKVSSLSDSSSLIWSSLIFGTKFNLFQPIIKLNGNNCSVKYSDVVLSSDSVQKIIPKFSVSGKCCSLSVKSKSILSIYGSSFFEGKIEVSDNARDYKIFVECDSLVLDDVDILSVAEPELIVNNSNGIINHEAKFGYISSEKLFYLMSRGFSESESLSLILNGYVLDGLCALPVKFKNKINVLFDKFNFDINYRF